MEAAMMRKTPWIMFSAWLAMGETTKATCFCVMVLLAAAALCLHVCGCLTTVCHDIADASRELS
jgi:hypothetical protein